MPGALEEVAEASVDVVALVVVEARRAVRDVVVDAIDENDEVSDELVNTNGDEADAGTLCRKAGSGLGIPDMVAWSELSTLRISAGNMLCFTVDFDVSGQVSTLCFPDESKSPCGRCRGRPLCSVWSISLPSTLCLLNMRPTYILANHLLHERRAMLRADPPYWQHGCIRYLAYLFHGKASTCRTRNKGPTRPRRTRT